jgi:hypothetical protein
MLQDSMSGDADTVSVLAPGHELPYRPSSGFLHGDTLCVSPLAQRCLFVLGQSECHGHPSMVSLRYHRSERSGTPAGLVN